MTVVVWVEVMVERFTCVRVLKVTTDVVSVLV